MSWWEDELEKARLRNQSNKKPFRFFGKEVDFGGRQYLPKSEYDIEMEKKWRNPWYSYDKEAGKTASVYPDKILRDEALRRENAELYGPEYGPDVPGSMPAPKQALGDPSKSGMLKSMMSDMMPMDMTRYYKERDTSFAGAMAKTMASGLAKAAKPKEMSGGRVRVGGSQRVFTPETQQMASWTAPAAASGYGETLADPTIETYLRPWRLKHGYT